MARAYAHQPYESTAVARLQHDRLEVTLTLSNQMAGALVAESERGVVDAANFGTFRLRLRELAGKLFTITSADAVLAPTLAEVQLSKIGEVEFVLIYPEPAQGRVRILAGYLRQLPVTYGGTLQVFDEDAKLLARADKLTRNNAALEWERSPPAPVAPAAPIAAAPAPAAVPTPNGWKYGAVLSLCLLWWSYRLHRRRTQSVLMPSPFAGGNAS